MTPAARHQAAIGVLDRWLTGTPAEQALTNWGRASRYAGSGDRQAVRDIVFDAIRCRRSFAHRGGADSGRGLVLGGLRARGDDPGAVFTGLGHAPEALGPSEADDPGLATGLVALDCPDWLGPDLQAALGADFVPVMSALRHRAPVFLRVNTARIDASDAGVRLLAEGIGTVPHPLAETALLVTDGARKIQTSQCFAEGLVELQDAASQAVVQALPVTPGLAVLDYCAGGGGKALALAARGARVTAHDADAGRMRDLSVRAARAGARIARVPPGQAPDPHPLVLVDAPCSGSGSWRRVPEGKWALTPARLADLVGLQARILEAAAALVAPGGLLAYATCSMIEAENGVQVAAFLARVPGWSLVGEHRFTPLQGGDGFFLAQLRRVA
ncbi:MAG: RsmB/NOP family class I SAM-dependent RNA methyltransferase [Gemmobacter sp.]